MPCSLTSLVQAVQRLYAGVLLQFAHTLTLSVVGAAWVVSLTSAVLGSSEEGREAIVTDANVDTALGAFSLAGRDYTHLVDAARKHHRIKHKLLIKTACLGSFNLRQVYKAYWSCAHTLKFFHWIVDDYLTLILCKTYEERILAWQQAHINIKFATILRADGVLTLIMNHTMYLLPPCSRSV
jgi:hypothetical protein